MQFQLAIKTNISSFIKEIDHLNLHKFHRVTKVALLNLKIWQRNLLRDE